MISFYQDEGVSHIGRKLSQEIIGKIEVLSDHPEIGRIVPEFNVANIRELIHPPFRIIYLYEKHAIKVIRVWRSERMLILPTEDT